MELNSLLAQMVERKASDLHLVAGVPPIFRIDGELIPAPMPNLTEEDVNTLLRSALPEDKLAAAQEGRDFSATLRHDDQAFHCQVFRDRGRLAAAIRLLPKRIPSLEEMRLPPMFEKLTHLRQGLVLVVGPTGSGKTTTLFSMLDHINQTRSERIYTLEYPLNYVLRSKLSLVTQRVVGEDVESWEGGLRSIKDADPDVVFLSEMRTPEVARLAAEMAEAGVLVFSQMTADTAGDAVQRLVKSLGKRHGSSQSLQSWPVQAVLAQRLLVRAGQVGRVAANEILLMTPRVRQMIADGQTEPGLLELAMTASHSVGMRTMDEALLGLYAEGAISRETVEAHLKDKTRLP